jgi:hypothetical protein
MLSLTGQDTSHTDIAGEIVNLNHHDDHKNTTSTRIARISDSISAVPPPYTSPRQARSQKH